jgi:hypothetical protein
MQSKKFERRGEKFALRATFARKPRSFAVSVRVLARRITTRLNPALVKRAGSQSPSPVGQLEPLSVWRIKLAKRLSMLRSRRRVSPLPMPSNP